MTLLFAFPILLCEAIEDIDELVQPLRALSFPLRDPFRHAFFDVASNDRQADAIERRLGGGQLLKNLDTEPRFFDHPADSADLPLDTVQPRDKRLLLRWVQHVR